MKALKNRTAHVLSNPCAFLFTLYLCNLWFNQRLCPIISVLHYTINWLKVRNCSDYRQIVVRRKSKERIKCCLKK